MKIVILIYQIIQEKFAYDELFMLVMIEYIIYMFKMVKKVQNSGLEIVAGVNTSLKLKGLAMNFRWTGKPIYHFQQQGNINTFQNK